MDDVFYSVSGSSEYIAALTKMTLPNVEVGKPIITESLNDGLDGSMNFEELKQIFETVDIFAKSGVDLLLLATTLIHTLKTTDQPADKTRIAKGDKEIAVITADSDPVELGTKLSQ